MEGLCPVLDPHPLSTKSFRISTLWILLRKFKNATRCDEEGHLLGLRWIVGWGMLWASWSMAASGRPGHRGVAFADLWRSKNVVAPAPPLRVLAVLVGDRTSSPRKSPSLITGKRGRFLTLV